MYKVKRLFLASVLCVSSLTYAEPISLDNLIEIALKNNSSIKKSHYQKESKGASLEIAKAGYYPKVSAVGEVAQYDIDSGVSQTDGEVTGASLSANQLLYDFGKTGSSIDAAQEEFSSSDEEIAIKISETILQTKQAYYDILREQQNIALYKEMIAIDALHLEQVEEYHKAGIRTLIDVTDAKLQLSNSKLQLLDAQYAFEESQANLGVVIGVNNTQAYEIQKDSHILEIASSIEPLSTKVESLIKKAFSNRPELKLYSKKMQVQEYQLKGIRSEYYPSIELDASYSDKDSDKIASLNSKQMSAGIYLKWNLYTGDTTQASIKDNYAVVSSLKQDFFQTKLEIKKAVSIAFSRMKSSEESIDIAFLAVKLASQKFDLAKQRYKAGISDLVEFNDATLEYSEAKSTLINNYYNYLDAKAQLEYAIGYKEL